METKNSEDLIHKRKKEELNQPQNNHKQRRLKLKVGALQELLTIPRKPAALREAKMAGSSLTEKTSG